MVEEPNNLAPSGRREPLAIVGIGCRFPLGAHDPDAFWDLLCSGADAIVDVPEDRWSLARFVDPDASRPGKTNISQGGYLRARIDQFDAAFFGISPREAAHIDPQQRLMLEVTFEAFEDAGIPPSSVAGSDIGVYVGGFMLDSQLLQLDSLNRGLIGTHTATSATLVMLSNKLSHWFDLRGPSLTIDTACSSSLVALHYACQDLWLGRTSAAVVGGVNVLLKPEYTIAMTKGGFLSPECRSKAFDASADGYVRGEGAAAIILKPVSEAIARRDPIYALVRATGVNQDGRTPGITVPNGEAQLALIRRVCAEGGVEPSEICYVEAHGTGTPVGDPTEAVALGRAMGAGRGPAERCWVGSAKANIGHLEAAAGIAGVIKTALCLKHRRIPPQIHLRTPNANVPWDELGIRLPTRMEELPNHGTLHAGVNSFGYGGTNAHALLQAFAGTHRPDADGPKLPTLVPVSARSDGAIRDLARAYRGLLEHCGDDTQGRGFADLVRSMGQRREHHPHRAAIVAASRESLLEGLRAFLEDEPADDVVRPQVPAPDHAGPVFVFTGMGPQWWSMGRELCSCEPVFRDALEKCDAAIHRVSDCSILREMLAPEVSSRMRTNWVAQQANFALQVALVALWESWGIRPAAAIGHSVGEIAAAYACGCLDLDSAARVVAHRSLAQQRVAGRGGMLFAALREGDAAELPAVRDGRVCVGAVNDPAALALSGDLDGLAEIASALDASGVFNRRLDVEVAYHSHHMDPLAAELQAALKDLLPEEPRIPLYSTVMGERVRSSAHDADYWWKNVRRPVRFACALEQCLADGGRTFVEIGPHPVLRGSIRQVMHRARISGSVIASLHRSRPERETILASLGHLYALGSSVDWERLHGCCERFFRLPAYPWQRETYWIESTQSRRERIGAIGHPLLGTRQQGPRPRWRIEIPSPSTLFLRHHRVDGASVLPAAAYVEAAFAARREVHRERAGILEHLHFRELRGLPEGGKVELQMEVDEAGAFSIFSRLSGMDEDDDWTLNATGRICTRTMSEPPRFDFASVQARCPEVVHAAELYAGLAERGLDYGELFRTVRRVWRSTNETLAELDLDPRLAAEASTYLLHPALLDGAFHSLLGALEFERGDRELFVPVLAREFAVRGNPSSRLWAHGRTNTDDPERPVADIVVCDELGSVVTRVVGLQLRSVPRHSNVGREEYLRRCLYEYALSPEEPNAGDQAVPSGARWLLMGNGASVSPRLAGAFARRGAECVHVPGPDRGGNLGYALAALEEPVDGALLLLPDGDVIGRSACLSVLDCLEALRSEGSPRPARLCVVSRNAQDPNLGSLSHASALGFGRVAMNELTDITCTLADLDRECTDADLDILVARLLTGSPEEEIAIRNGVCLRRRLRSLAPHEAAGLGRPVELGEEQAFEWCGDAGEARLRERPRYQPTDGRVELRQTAVALGAGRLSPILSRARMTGEVSDGNSLIEVGGPVLRIGCGVETLRPGDEVVAVVPKASLVSHAIMDARACLRIETAHDGGPIAPVGLLVPLVSALYALREIARLLPGERVLVCVGAGGLGVAGACVARWLGGEVVIASSDGARLSPVGEPGLGPVVDAWSPAFRDDVMALTNGRAIDVVLGYATSVPSTHVEIVLRRFGRVVEIDPVRGGESRRGLVSLAPSGATVTSLDTRGFVLGDRSAFEKLAREVLAALESRQLTAPDLEERSVEDLAEIGEIAAPAGGPDRLRIRMDVSKPTAYGSTGDGALFRRDGTYLVSGGLQGFGLAVAKFMAREGAGNLVLFGRRGLDTPGAELGLAEIEASGARGLALAADASVRSDVEDLLRAIDGRLPPLRGIVHSAMVLDDGFLEDLGEERIDRVMRPKALGAWNLHVSTLDRDLDYFVMFSSVASLVGTPGQASYAAANAFLDALAVARRSAGLAATSVNWGLLGDVGAAAGNAALVDHLGRFGVRPIPVDRAFDGLRRILRMERSATGFFDFDWSVFSRLPWARRLSRFDEVKTVSTSGSDVDGSLLPSIMAVKPELRPPLMTDAVRRIVGRILMLPHDRIPAQHPLSHVGLDSLMAVELQIAIHDAVGVEIPPVELLNSGVEDLSLSILRRL